MGVYLGIVYKLFTLHTEKYFTKLKKSIIQNKTQYYMHTGYNIAYNENSGQTVSNS